MAFIHPDTHPATIAVRLPMTPTALVLLTQTTAPMTLLRADRADPLFTLRLPEQSAHVLDLLRSRHQPLTRVPVQPLHPSEDSETPEPLIECHLHITPGLMAALSQAAIPFLLERQRDCWQEWGEQIKRRDQEHGILRLFGDDAAGLSALLNRHGFWHHYTETNRWDEVVSVLGAPTGYYARPNAY